MIRIRLERAPRVVADLHLRPEEPEEIAAFAAQVRELAGAGADLAVLGDLVDAWPGPGHWREPAWAPLLAAARELTAAGGRLWLLRGNRDVLFEPADLAPLGARLADALLAPAEEGLALLSHGDEYCLRDRPYQRLRRALRWPPLRRLLRALPYRLRLRLAARMRGVSRAAVARKPLDALALEPAAVAAALAEAGAGLAVIGHLHREEQRELPGGLRLRVLPAWSPERPPAAI
ncbi:MAG: UDP-2,3-diacylglucosamine diphosphatase [Planctomycetota bacterium]|nr:MAG: UDP-2,3-diacylglucosamine diphosphatase [Planctomycetota bacterium]